MTRLNWNTAINDSVVRLIPYRKMHVEKYHEWMSSADVLYQTGSEPLTLKEEYANQLSWRDDDTKLTFIIALPNVSGRNDTIIGDVNVFFNAPDEDESKCEIEVMIGEENQRRKGFAKRAVGLMIAYVRKYYPSIKGFVAKVKKDNLPSIYLFKKQLQFVETKPANVFEEITLENNNPSLLISEMFQSGSSDAHFELPLVESKDLETEELRAMGNDAFKKGEFEKACIFYDHAIEVDARDPVLRSNRSIARMRVGEYFGALSDAYVSVQLDKSNLKARHRLGAAWGVLGFTEYATAVYDQALADFPEEKGTISAMQRRGKEVVDFKKSNLSPALRVSLEFITESAVFVEYEIEMNPDPITTRFRCLLFLWNELSGEERVGVAGELLRIGYGDKEMLNITADEWRKAPKRKLPGVDDEVITEASLGVEFKKWRKEKLSAHPLGRIGALGWLFEGLAKKNRKLVAETLIDLSHMLSN